MIPGSKRDHPAGPKPPGVNGNPVGKAAGPGRPKDLGKRAAILDASRRMFTQHGFDGASMDLIAAEAGVSKLTVYSHFGDKETLYAAVVKSYCEQQLPSALFEAEPDAPLRERLMTIARAFYLMISNPEAVAGHRMLCTPQLAGSPLSQLFWEAGPKRIQGEFAALLERRVAAGELDIADAPRAAAQFFCLLKGESHARLVFGCGAAGDFDVDEHLTATVELFLRAYATKRAQ